MTETLVKPEPRLMTFKEFRAEFGQLYKVCDQCNYDTHRCHFCGENLIHGSWVYRRSYNYFKRDWFVLLTPHWLSDCRPDLMDGSYDGSKHTDGRLG